MTDRDIFENLHMDIDLSKYQEKLFSKKDRLFINDTNNNDYSSKYIQLDERDIRTVLTHQPEKELVIPIAITSNTFTGPLEGSRYGIVGGRDLIRFTNSVLSLIGDIQVEENGKSCTYEPFTSLYNTNKTRLEHSKEWIYSAEAEELCYSLDNSSGVGGGSNNAVNIANYNCSGPLSKVITQGVAGGAANNGMVTTGPMYLPGNDGLLMGSDRFFSKFRYVPGITVNGNVVNAYIGHVTIKLKFLSNFFKEMDFPAFTNFVYKFYLNFVHGQPNSFLNAAPIQYLQTQTTVTDFFNVPSAPVYTDLTFWVGALNMDISNSCRLYYKSIKPNPDKYAEIKRDYDTRRVKEISYITCDVYKLSQFANYTNTSQNELQFASSVKSPQRVWILGYDSACSPYATGAGNANGFASNGVAFTDANLLNIQLCNILIGRDPYYKYDLQSDVEFFDEAMQATATYGIANENNSLLSYNDWMRANSIYIFDLTRWFVLNGDINNVTLSAKLIQNNLSVNGIVRTSPRPIDLIFLVERLEKKKMIFDRGGITFESD